MSVLPLSKLLGVALKEHCPEGKNTSVGPSDQALANKRISFELRLNWGSELSAKPPVFSGSLVKLYSGSS